MLCTTATNTSNTIRTTMEWKTEGRWTMSSTFGEDLEMRLLVLDDTVLLQTGAWRRHFARVTRLALHADDERALGDVLTGKPHRHGVLSLHGGCVWARVGHVAVVVVNHRRLVHITNTHTHTHTHTHTRLTALCRDYPDEPVPER